MERSEEDLKMMCLRLVRFEEAKLGRENPKVAADLKLTEHWGCSAGEMVRTSKEGSSIRHCDGSRRNRGKSLPCAMFIYALSLENNLLDLGLEDDFKIVLEPGMLEELDLKLSSLGY